MLSTLLLFFKLVTAEGALKTTIFCLVILCTENVFFPRILARGCPPPSPGVSTKVLASFPNLEGFQAHPKFPSSTLLTLNFHHVPQELHSSRICTIQLRPPRITPNFRNSPQGPTGSPQMFTTHPNPRSPKISITHPETPRITPNFLTHTRDPEIHPKCPSLTLSPPKSPQMSPETPRITPKFPSLPPEAPIHPNFCWGGKMFFYPRFF